MLLFISSVRDKAPGFSRGDYVTWLERWQRIRSDLPSEIDGTSESDWLELERKIFAKPVRP